MSLARHNIYGLSLKGIFPEECDVELLNSLGRLIIRVLARGGPEVGSSLTLTLTSGGLLISGGDTIIYYF